MRYTLRQIEVFLATARYTNISRAAESLAMSQSAASGALNELENRYQAPLFDRVGKRLQLNTLGEAMRPHAEALMAQASELDSFLQQDTVIGKLKLGATLTIGNYLVVSMLADFMQRYQESQVMLSVANTEEIARRVLHYELDFGLIEGEFQHPDLDIIDWRGDELVVFCAPDHPFADKKHITRTDLLEAKWILREQGSGTRQALERTMHDIFPQLNVHLELEHTEAIKRAVEANLGIACLSKITVSDAFKRGSLVPLTLSEAERDMQRRFYLILHKKKHRCATINAWLEFCGINTVHA